MPYTNLSLPPLARSPVPAEQGEKTSSKSPLAVPTLQISKPSGSNPSPLTQSHKEPIKNGRSSSQETSIQKRSLSPDNKPRAARSTTSATVSKVISAPLTLSDSDSDREQQGSASPRYNGIPERYRQDLERDRHSRKKHKHRTDKQYRHSQSKHKSRDNDKRRPYFNEPSKERVVQSKNHRKRERDNEREYYTSASKIRKSDYVRHR